ncbi:hypothetical protein BSL78_14911 [Apostichopus japonicus]|uniref:SWIM-type domain-containing protein n=1 Tax=Stichopus japonicus TaxID=307972 RepID=A0A2G8KJT1_STIJA|nr:hypothetical protein BSL78_14911 [Apostichopus japonicus]
MEQGYMSLDKIEHWSVQAMKDFLRVQGLKTTERKRELQSLVYSAMQMKVPIKMDEVEEDKLRSKLYSESLVVDWKPLPDPFTELVEKDGWLAEKDSRHLWPPLSYFEIAEYLLVDATCLSQPLRPSSTSGSSSSSFMPTSLKDRLLSDYKEGKAFSYFESKWLKEIFYHHISEDSPVCFLKADCLPSQNVRSIPHKSWVVLEKKTGKIRSAYCTCLAGLGTTCNHVAAVVFKVDHAFMMGQSAAVPCTSKQCTWNVYKGMPVATVLEGKKISCLE